MFGSVLVLTQSLPVHGAFNPWWVLLWLALMAGCLVLVAGVVALFQVATTFLRSRSRVHNRLRIPASTDGTSNP